MRFFVFSIFLFIPLAAQAQLFSCRDLLLVRQLFPSHEEALTLSAHPYRGGAKNEFSAVVLQKVAEEIRTLKLKTQAQKPEDVQQRDLIRIAKLSRLIPEIHEWPSLPPELQAFSLFWQQEGPSAYLDSGILAIAALESHRSYQDVKSYYAAIKNLMHGFVQRHHLMADTIATMARFGLYHWIDASELYSLFIKAQQVCELRNWSIWDNAVPLMIMAHQSGLSLEQTAESVEQMRALIGNAALRSDHIGLAQLAQRHRLAYPWVATWFKKIREFDFLGGDWSGDSTLMLTQLLAVSAIPSSSLILQLSQVFNAALKAGIPPLGKNTAHYLLRASILSKQPLDEVLEAFKQNKLKAFQLWHVWVDDQVLAMLTEASVLQKQGIPMQPIELPIQYHQRALRR